MPLKDCGIEAESESTITIEDFKIDDFEVEEIEGAEALHNVSGESGQSSEMLTREQFHKGFCMSFNMGSAVTKLESLHTPEDDAAAWEASNVIYDVALESEYLRFLIEPSNLWVQRSMVIFAFAAPKYYGCRAELQARKEQEMKQAEVE